MHIANSNYDRPFNMKLIRTMHPSKSHVLFDASVPHLKQVIDLVAVKRNSDVLVRRNNWPTLERECNGLGMLRDPDEFKVSIGHYTRVAGDLAEFGALPETSGIVMAIGTKHDDRITSRMEELVNGHHRLPHFKAWCIQDYEYCDTKHGTGIRFPTPQGYVYIMMPIVVSTNTVGPRTRDIFFSQAYKKPSKTARCILPMFRFSKHWDLRYLVDVGLTMAATGTEYDLNVLHLLSNLNMSRTEGRRSPDPMTELSHDERSSNKVVSKPFVVSIVRDNVEVFSAFVAKDSWLKIDQ